MSSIINSQHAKWAAAAGSMEKKKMTSLTTKSNGPWKNKKDPLIMNSGRNSWWDVEDVIILHLRLFLQNQDY